MTRDLSLFVAGFVIGFLSFPVAVVAGAGRSPADKGHGWPAFAPPVGPGAYGSHGVDITLSDDPLLFVSPLQGLPPLRTQVNVDTSRELIR